MKNSAWAFTALLVCSVSSLWNSEMFVLLVDAPDFTDDSWKLCLTGLHLVSDAQPNEPFNWVLYSKISYYDSAPDGTYPKLTPKKWTTNFELHEGEDQPFEKDQTSITINGILFEFGDLIIKKVKPMVPRLNKMVNLAFDPDEGTTLKFGPFDQSKDIKPYVNTNFKPNSKPATFILQMEGDLAKSASAVVNVSYDQLSNKDSVTIRKRSSNLTLSIEVFSY